MKNQELPEFKKTLDIAGVIFRTEITKDLVNVYFEFLKEHELRECIGALKAYIGEARTRVYFPQPGELLSIIESKSIDFKGFDKFLVQYILKHRDGEKWDSFHWKNNVPEHVKAQLIKQYREEARAEFIHIASDKKNRMNHDRPKLS